MSSIELEREAQIRKEVYSGILEVIADVGAKRNTPEDRAVLASILGEVIRGVGGADRQTILDLLEKMG